jgi:WhiB family transcriptional regulator, redox-sensing transcriptional regulator
VSGLRDVNAEVFSYLRVLRDDPDLEPSTNRRTAVPAAGHAVPRHCEGCGAALGEDRYSWRRFCSRECRDGRVGPAYEQPIDLDDSWTAQAACLGCDPDLFFPSRGESCVEAKAVCRVCPVRVECLEFALATGEAHGIWGGASERERRRIRRQRGHRREARGVA